MSDFDPVDNEVLENSPNPKSTIDWKLYKELKRLGIIHADVNEVDIRSFNVGNSDYSKHIIQPWSIWVDWNLNAWDADIVKRVLRHKSTDSREQDYIKIIHICLERIRQLRLENNEISN